MILLALELAALLLAAVRLAAWIAPPRDHTSTTALDLVLVALGLAVLTQAMLGAAHLLTPEATFIVLAAAALATFVPALRRHGRTSVVRPAATGASAVARPAELALVAAIAVALALRLHAGLGKTTFLYDALSFHLHAPAEWHLTQRLGIVPAVFGDPAPAYNPSNAELVYHLLLAPLGSDYLAGTGQVPFAAVAVVAIHATARRIGARRPTALAAALAFLLVPEVWQQAPTAMVDLAVAALFLASLAALLRARALLGAATSTPAAITRAVAMTGVAFGLFAGTKFVAPVFGLPLFVWIAALLARHRARVRARDLALLAGAFVATGGFWYLRNLVVAGNPIYPVALQIGPLSLARGLYDGAAMRAWDYHLPIDELEPLGEMLLDAGLGFVVAAVATLAAGRSWLTALTATLLALLWFVVPYQHARFLFPVFGVAAVAMASAAGAPGRVRRRVGQGALLAATAGSILQFPTWDRLAVAAVAIAVGAAALLARGPLARLPARRLGGAAALAGATALVIAVAIGFRGYRTRYPGWNVGDDIDGAWAWVYDHVREAVVAYAGTNLAFPLHGAGLANRVVCVNVSGGPDDKLHHFGRRRLVPAPAQGAEPAPYRDLERVEDWLDNLARLRVDTLVVSSLYPIVARNVRHDAAGFPVERAWADARPGRFRLRYAAPTVRVYSVTRPVAPNAGSGGVEPKGRP